MEDSRFRIVADGSSLPGAAVEKDGVHFGYYTEGGERPVLLLYRKGTEEIAVELPFPEESGRDGFYSAKVKLRASEYEYNFREGEQVITDPYARKLGGRETFGKLPSASPHGLRGGFVTRKFDWEGDRKPDLAWSECVMYHLHVRGFTKSPRSGVRKKGTFAGLREKLPYLSGLGVNQLKLMPAYEFSEVMPKESRNGVPSGGMGAFVRAEEKTRGGETYRMNYWGYGPGFYFAPKASYAAGADADVEFKELVKAAHRLGIEILMEFHFTDQTDVQMIAECLRYWAAEYHVDGFSVIGRGGLPEELARLPLFRSVKLVCGWYPDWLVKENAGHSAAKRARIAESNDGFLVDCRRFLKGDEDSLGSFAARIGKNPAGCPPVNYVTNHDGFTLLDLVSYDRKYNAANGEQERDGTDYNFSWNCGVEGPTRKREVLRLRMRQRKNALAMLLFAQGIPMLLAGDESGNSQDGNNNPYCHDSELTWLDWKQTRANRELTQFVKNAIAYRKAHGFLHQKRELRCMDNYADGYPDLSFHSERAWYGAFDRTNRHVGCMYSGRYAGEPGLFYIAYNLCWAEQEFGLPILPKNLAWHKVMDTSLAESFLPEAEPVGEVKLLRVPARTVVVLESRENLDA